jgi:hypothetical protein
LGTIVHNASLWIFVGRERAGSAHADGAGVVLCEVQGEMRERLNRADSKSVEPHVGSVGSNPTLSVADRSLEMSVSEGEMTERPKVHAWKACVL